MKKVLVLLSTIAVLAMSSFANPTLRDNDYKAAHPVKQKRTTAVIIGTFSSGVFTYRFTSTTYFGSGTVYELYYYDGVSGYWLPTYQPSGTWAHVDSDTGTISVTFKKSNTSSITESYEGVFNRWD